MTQLWQAAAPSGATPDQALLTRLASEADALLEGQPLAAAEDDLKAIEGWLDQGEEQWLTWLEPLSQEQWLALAIFFTAAEEQLANWHCGSNNPAIIIFRALKQQGQLPEKPKMRAIKALTSNRYIPYGAVL